MKESQPDQPDNIIRQWPMISQSGWANVKTEARPVKMNRRLKTTNDEDNRQ